MLNYEQTEQKKIDSIENIGDWRQRLRKQKYHEISYKNNDPLINSFRVYCDKLYHSGTMQ